MQISTVFALFSVLATSAIAAGPPGSDVLCHVELVNARNQKGCFQFYRSSFAIDTVFPIPLVGTSGCSVQASPRAGFDSCNGIVVSTTPACGTTQGQNIIFDKNKCPNPL